MVTYQEIRTNPEVLTYIDQADKILEKMAYTDHSVAHVALCAHRVSAILTALEYDQRTIELGKIAAFLHDIGNIINRVGHAHHGAALAFEILRELGMPPEEVGQVVSAIGHHDEESSFPVSEIGSALILADKSDVRYTRVRNYDPDAEDIHDRVNYAVKTSDLTVEKEEKTITLRLTIDTNVSSVTNYFEIFLGRMLLCRRAAEYFGMEFKLIINNSLLL